MRVVVTRPGQEARQWVERLRAAGHDVVSLPLIAIGPAPDARAVHAAWSRIGDFAAVMFVSANAVREFFRLRGTAQFTPRAWAPGPATRAELVSAGVAHEQVDAPGDDAAQFDSEALWARVRGQVRAGDRVLVVRGAVAGGARVRGTGAHGDGVRSARAETSRDNRGKDFSSTSEGGADVAPEADTRGSGRGWLAEQLAACGAQVEYVAAYRRSLPTWSEAQRSQAAACAGAGATWLFSSAEAVRNLRALVPDCDWSAARAIATHPRIADAVHELGFGVVRESRPGFDDVRAALESSQ